MTGDWRTTPMTEPEPISPRPKETVDRHEPTGVVGDVLEARGSRYGEFIDNATIAQDLKEYVRGCPGWSTLDYDQKEAIDNISIKMSRILSKGTDTSYMDNWVDIAGYATLVVDRRS